MGQKVNPIGLRIGINRTWDSRWFSDKNYADKLVADLKLREFVKDRLKLAGISKVIIERAAQNTTVTVYAARPGVIIGKKGADIEKLRSDLSKEIGSDVALNIVEIRKPEMDAQLVAEGIAQQLERRVSFRRAMKRATQSAMRLGSQGIRVNVAGRLGGTDIARTEWYREGRVPLHTLRADLDYGFSEALTTYGIIGVKVWIYKGDIMEHDPLARDKRQADGRVQDGSTGGGRPAKTE
jgi:small subunit ribosomal protein S3